MSSSPEQSNSFQTPSLNVSQDISDVSVISAASIGSGGESPPTGFQGHTLSPPQLINVCAASSTPNSPHLGGNRRNKGRKMRKLLRLPQPLNPQNRPTVTEDTLESADHQQVNRALFVRMLKSWQIQPKKIRSFRRTKRRPDKQYHSDDGYTSDPGVIREAEDDDETDNDHDSGELRRQTHIQELERKAEKIRREMLGEEEETPEDDVDGVIDKPSQSKVIWRLNRGQATKSKSYTELQRKLDKIDSQLKEFRERGTLDTRGGGLRGRIGGGLMGIKGKLTNAGSKFKRKRSGTAPDEEPIDDEDDEPYQDDEMIDQITEDSLAESHAFTAEQEELISALKGELEALKLSSEEQKKKVEIALDQSERLGESLAVIIEKYEQERERADRLEGQINDITELHQHQVSDLRAQLVQIEHTTTNKCQDLEDAVDDFQSKFDQLDVHVHNLMDTDKEPPKVPAMVRKPMVTLLSFFLHVLAFILKLISIIRNKPLLMTAVLILVLSVLIYVVVT